MPRRVSIPLLVLSLALLSSNAFAGSSGQDAFSSALGRGPLAAALAAFVGGLLVSLTPCVYPMIAVTVSVFGATSAPTRGRGILLSSAFVLGIVVMFVTLGLVAAATANVFGAVLQNTWVVLGISLLFVAMALSMFGLFEFALPSGLINRIATMGGIGLRGAFVLGLVSGIVAAPCTGPVLTGILAWIATTRDFFLGTLAMTTFALGLGVPFFLVGAFAVQLPKGGAWMMTVKSVLGVVLLVVALYFAAPKLPGIMKLVPLGSTGWLASVLSLGFAGVVTFLVRKAPATAHSTMKVAAIALFTFGGFGVVTKLTRAEGTLVWQHDDYHAVKTQAEREQRPLLVDFTASWCTACKELDRQTFSDPAVKAEAARFLAVKVDASVDDDPNVQRTTQALGVKGLPTVILFDKTGREIRRFTDFVRPTDFLKALREVP